MRTRLFPVGEVLSQGGVACWPLQYACFGWLGSRATFQADYGNGRFFVVIHDPAVPRAQANPITLPRLTTDAVAATGLPATSLLETYAQWHRLTLEKTPGGLTLRFPGGSHFEVGIDEQGRASSFTGSMVAADLPPDAVPS